MRHLESLRFVDSIARAGSIRKAAEILSITSTALNRRLLALEDELGVPIFERLPRGVRLSAAGELLIHHIRSQLSDLDRVRSQIADLSGERRGHVAIACSQGLLPYFLPQQIARYREQHPAVTFSVALRDRAAAEIALADHSVDLALVFEPVRMAEFHTLIAVRQPVRAVMARDHPLATRDGLRLRDCQPYPVGFPSSSYGVRYLLDRAQQHSSVRLKPVIESDSFEFLRNYPIEEHLISFQIAIGLPGPFERDDLPFCHRPIDARDLPPGLLYLGQLRGRTLSVAAARFANQLVRALADRFERD
jgi:DNA-binding transcriptional LysR family regulator